jgi:glucose-1-phosphate thymidylyltransferase
MKGIILAGGLGTRLYPATRSINKQLLPVYDKPMIYYPLCTLMLAGIREILIITSPHELPMFKQLLADGSQWGVQLDYCMQMQPDGIAQAFILGKDFIGNDSVSLVLGDNILYGDGLPEKLKQAATQKNGATIFAYYVADPKQYGVIKFNEKHQPIDIIEKPKQFISHYAVTGLYFYDNNVISIAEQIKPSVRGELEITDVNRYYLQQNKLHVVKLSRGTAWLDTGTHQSLLDAANFIHVLEERQGLKIGSPEEVAWRSGFISQLDFEKEAVKQIKSGYGQYLLDLMT